MDRREFSKTLGWTALAAAAPTAVLGAASAPRVDRQDRKAWARTHFRGFENILMPSFTPDMKRLDEAGVRLDVRKSIEHGFFSSMLALETLTPPERKQFAAIAIDEAKGRIAIGSSLGAGPPEGPADLAGRQDVLKELSRLGSGHVLLNLAHATSEDEMVRMGTEFAESTDLAVVLWWANHHRFNRFAPNGIPSRAYDRLVEVPNIVALKFGSTDPAQVFDMHERYSKKVLIGTLWFNAMPLAVKHYGQQWSGATTIEMMQSPQKRYCVDWFNMLLAGKYDTAEDLYWRRVAPAFGEMMGFMNRNMPRGAHAWDHLKYYQFATGGNGGQSRKDSHQPDLPPIDVAFMNDVKAAFRKIDITPSDLPDEAFYVGRVNYDKGVRRPAPAKS